MKTLLAVVLSLCLLASPVFASKNTPSDHFGHLPMLQLVSVSPDGNNIAALFNGPDGPQVVVAPFGSPDIVPIVQLGRDKDRIDNIRWQNDDRLLITASYSRSWTGDRVRVSRLFTVKKDGKDLQVVKQKKKLKASSMDAFAGVMSTSTILSMLPNDPDHILMELWSDRDQGFSVYKVNPAENDFTKILVNNLKVNDWFANRAGVINFGRRSKWIAKDKEFEITFFYRDSNDKDFKEIYKERETTPGYFAIVGIFGTKMYVISDRKIGRKALWSYDLTTSKYEKIIYSHDKYDIDGAIVNFDETELLGVKYSDDYQRNHYFDGSRSKRQQFIEAAFSKFITWNAGESRDGNRVMVAAQRNNMPTTYFWLEVPTKKGGMWFSQYPYLGKTPLASTVPISFNASDEMELHGYLTMPVVKEGKGKPKLVIMPHGGPQSRDYQYFDPYVQFLANRGYAVLQVNFRGSEGFGSNYEVAGYKQWGKRMQKDIYDAFDWIKAQNVVDHENSCIVGASYGGFVALTASFQKPETFDCFVSIAGIGDLYGMVKSDAQNRRLRNWVYRTIGNPDKPQEAADLKAVSAINHLDKIKKPILLIHGTHDTRVKFKQSADFYEAAKSKRLDVEYIQLENGTHFLDEDTNRKAAFKAIDEFLSKHL